MAVAVGAFQEIVVLGKPEGTLGTGLGLALIATVMVSGGQDPCKKSDSKGENVHKKLLVKAAACNLALLLRSMLGAGTPEGLQDEWRRLFL